LMASSDPETFLKTLAERKMIQLAAMRESFHFMTDERQEIADNLKAGLQAEVDRYHLGLEITFVGLKDIHPPIDVAPAYQRVVSSQEEKEALIDDANAYEAQTIPLAKAQASTLTTGAEASRLSRVDQAAGEAARFVSLLAPESANPAVFRLRLKYDMLDQTLAKPSKTIIGGASNTTPECYLDLRTAEAPNGSREIKTP